jgi:hypothetical protein
LEAERNFVRNGRCRHAACSRENGRWNRRDGTGKIGRMIRAHLALHRVPRGAVMTPHFLAFRAIARALDLRGMMAVRQAAHPVAARAVEPALRQKSERRREQRKNQDDGVNAPHIAKSNTNSERPDFHLPRPLIARSGPRVCVQIRFAIRSLLRAAHQTHLR